MKIELDIPVFLLEEISNNPFLGKLKIESAVLAAICSGLVDVVDMDRQDKPTRKFIETNYPDLHKVTPD